MGDTSERCIAFRRATSGIRGQDTAIAVIDRSLRDSRVHHAYLFEGPDGIGKHAVALAFAEALVRGPAGDLGGREITRRIAQGVHPDVVAPDADLKTGALSVDAIREIVRSAAYLPHEGAARVVILRDAELLLPDTAPAGPNALLKTLEEPPPHFHLVLTSSAPDRLLVTTRSRCQRVRFAPLSDADVDALLGTEPTDPSERATVLALARGSLGQARALAASGIHSLVGLLERLDDALSARATTPVLELAAEVAAQKELPRALELIALYYRDLAVAATGAPDERLALRASAARIRERARTHAADVWCERALAIELAHRELPRMYGPELTLDALLSAARTSA